ncbi:DUF4124 domain-containing protein [Colwellia sp. MEBiC06753]
MQKSLLTLLITSISFSLAAQDTTIYRWVDSNNVVHFSHAPPTDKDYATVDVKVSYAAPAKSDSNSSNANDDFQAEEEVLSAAEIEKRNAEITKKNCDSAKENFKTLTNFEQILVEDENGQSRVLTEEEKKKHLKLSQKQMESYCKDQGEN